MRTPPVSATAPRPPLRSASGPSAGPRVELTPLPMATQVRAASVGFLAGLALTAAAALAGLLFTCIVFGYPLGELL